MALAVTQPYIGKRHIELIDSNTDPNFNQVLSAHAFLAQAQQALIKLTNPSSDPLTGGVAQGSGVDYLLPKNITDLPGQTTNRDAYKADVDAAIVAITTAIKHVYDIVADANV